MLVLGILARVSNSEMPSTVTPHQPTLVGWAVAPLFFLLRILLACHALPADVGPIVLVISCIEAPFPPSLNGKP